MLVHVAYSNTYIIYINIHYTSVATCTCTYTYICVPIGGMYYITVWCYDATFFSVLIFIFDEFYFVMDLGIYICM